MGVNLCLGRHPWSANYSRRCSCRPGRLLHDLHLVLIARIAMMTQVAAISRNILCGWDEVILVVGLTWEHEFKTYGRL